MSELISAIEIFFVKSMKSESFHIFLIGHPMTWTAYHRLSDINGYLDYLAKSYPNLCSVRSIGNSIENRPLKVLRISNGNPSNRAIWIDAGIHA